MPIVYDTLKYRNLMIIGSILIVLLLLLDIQTQNYKSVIDIVFNLVFILTFTFAYLGYRKRIIFIGLIVAALEWNLALLTNPLIGVSMDNQILKGLKTVSVILSVISGACLVGSFTNYIKSKSLNQELDYEIKFILGIIFGFTLVLQFTIRF
jgi:hypothetical protein